MPHALCSPPYSGQNPNSAKAILLQVEEGTAMNGAQGEPTR
jgi:hypothetical protein